MRAKYLCALLVITLLAGICPAQDAATLDRCKRATGLLLVYARGRVLRYGPAVCVNPAGYFVTSNDLIPGREEHATAGQPRPLPFLYRIVMNPGEPDQRILPAALIGYSAAGYVAIIQATADKPLPALDPGDISTLAKGMPLSVLGFPDQRQLSPTGGEYPRLKEGKVTIKDVQQVGGEVVTIFADGQVEHTYEGAPVLDSTGRLMGVLIHDGDDRHPSMIQSIGAVARTMAKPMIWLDVSQIDALRFEEEQSLLIHVATIGTGTPWMDAAKALASAPGRGAPPGRSAPGGRRGGTQRNNGLTVDTENSGQTLRNIVPQQIGDGLYKLNFVPIPAALNVRYGDEYDIRTVRIDAYLTEDGIELAHVTRILGFGKGTPISIAEANAILEKQAVTDASAARPAARDVLSAPTVLDLNGQAVDVVPGGGGRYLFLWIQSQRKVAVFDAKTRTLRQPISLPSSDVLLAATATKLIVFVRNAGVVQRWDIEKLTKEATAPLPKNQKIVHVASGHAGNGPVLMVTDRPPDLLEVATLKPMNINGDLTDQWGGAGDAVGRPAASADGHVFAARDLPVSPTGIRRVAVKGTGVEPQFRFISAGRLLLSDDGNTVLSFNGLFDANLKPISGDVFGNLNCFPAYPSAYFLANKPGDMMLPKAPLTVSMYSMNDRRLLYTFPVLDEILAGKLGNGSVDPLPLNKRMHLMVDDGVLATVDESGSKLIVRQFDLGKATGASDAIVVTSAPPTTARRGTTYAFNIRVTDHLGTLSYKIEMGPSGMTVSPAGEVQWKVPTTGTESSVQMNILVENKSGQQVRVTAKIDLEAVADPVKK